MLKWMKEQKKLDADFFLELSDEAQDINELCGFSDDDIARGTRVGCASIRTRRGRHDA